jgi:carboxylesterase
VSSVAERTSSDPSAVTADGAPFFFRGQTTGCLLLHGFSAAPQEMFFLGEQLHAAGHTVSGVRLAGHGTSLEDFARATRQDWYASAVDGLMELRAHGTPLAVVGQSMGALLALQLAADHPDDVAAVALLAPAVRLSRRWLHWIRPLVRLVAGPQRFINKSRSDIADPEARAQRRTYSRISLTAFSELLELQRAVRQVLPRVRQPVMIVHSCDDHTCSPASVDILKRSLAGKVQTLILENSYHVVSVDKEKDRVAATVATFIGAAVPRR